MANRLISAIFTNVEVLQYSWLGTEPKENRLPYRIGVHVEGMLADEKFAVAVQFDTETWKPMVYDGYTENPWWSLDYADEAIELALPAAKNAWETKRWMRLFPSHTA